MDKLGSIVNLYMHPSMVYKIKPKKMKYLKLIWIELDDFNFFGLFALIMVFLLLYVA